LLRLLVVFDLSVLVIACGVGWSMAQHDRHLASFKHRLYELPIPDGARVLERRAAIRDGHSEFADISAFDPYRNHCEYRVSIELATDLSVEEVGAFLEATGADLSGLSVGLQGAGRVRIEDIDQGEPGWDPRCNRGIGL
jgi:hypothetical protein